MNKVITYIKESFDEVVHNVTWPTFLEAQKSALLVLVSSVIFALVVALIDTGVDNILSFLY